MDRDDESVDFNTVSLLIPKSKEGDQSARDELLGMIQDYLHRAAKANMDPTLQQKLGASDIVQQSFLRVIQHFEKFKGSSSAEFHGWLKTIVVNEIRNTRRGYRSLKRDVAREKHTAEHYIADNANLTPSSEAINAERLELFESILKDLPDEQAEVIRLRNINELSFKEIGEKMERTENAASKLWYRAMLKFEEKLKSSGEFDSWNEHDQNTN